MRGRQVEHRERTGTERLDFGKRFFLHAVANAAAGTDPDRAGFLYYWEQCGGEALVDLIRFETHTCYLGERGAPHAWGHGCGKCPACELRARGYEQYAR